MDEELQGFSDYLENEAVSYGMDGVTAAPLKRGVPTYIPPIQIVPSKTASPAYAPVSGPGGTAPAAVPMSVTTAAPSTSTASASAPAPSRTVSRGPAPAQATSDPRSPDIVFTPDVVPGPPPSTAIPATAPALVVDRQPGGSVGGGGGSGLLVIGLGVAAVAAFWFLAAKDEEDEKKRPLSLAELQVDEDYDDAPPLEQAEAA